MDIINNAIGEYQQMIGIHDKQPWERSVERAVSQSLHNLTRKRAKVNKDLIDVDLVRGSTFSKIKPRHSWLTVSWKALMRVLFLPFYYKWWTNCCGRTGYSLLVILYISQISSIYIYLSDDLTPNDEALSLSHLLTPSIMMIILAIVHTQIMSSTFDQQPQPQPQSPSLQSNQSSKEKKYILNNYSDSSESLPKNHESPQDRNTNKHHPIDSSLCECCMGSMDDESFRNSSELRRTDSCDSRNFFREDSVPTEIKVKDESFGNVIIEPEGTGTFTCKQIERSSSERTVMTIYNPKRCTCSNGKTNLKTVSSLAEEEEEDEFDSCGLSSLLIASQNTDMMGSNLERLNKSDGHDTNSTTSSLNSDDDDDDDEEDDDVAVEDIVVMHDTGSDKGTLNVPDAKQGEGYGTNGCIMTLKTECLRCSSMGKNTNLKKEGVEDIQNIQNNNRDASDGCLIRKRHMTQGNGGNQKAFVKYEFNEALEPSAMSLPLSLKTDSKHFLRPSSMDTQDKNENGTKDLKKSIIPGKSGFSNDENFLEKVEMPEPVEILMEAENKNPDGNGSTQCKPPSTEVELMKSYSKKSISTTSNKVSCIIWDGGELQKVDLTVLDIGWNIIKKVEKSCLSYDYLLLGASFSILLALTPIIFRVYHNWSILEGLKTFDNATDFNQALNVAVGHNWRQVIVICNGIIQRFCLSCLLFFMLAVSERTFYQRLLYAKNFCYLTSLRRARKYQLPHFRLNKVRNIKTWLSIRSFLKRRGPQRSVEIIVSTAFLAAVVIVSIICIELLQDYGSFLNELGNWELVVWGLSIGVFLLRFITLGTNINKKYRNFSVLITEQINLYLHMEQKPHKKNELMMANSVLKLAEDLLKEVESPFKVSGLSANPLLYNITKVVVLSAFSAVLTELLGFKLKLHKIKIRS